MIMQHIRKLSPPLMPSPTSPSSSPSSTTPPPPNSLFSMVSVIKLPICKGVGNQDLDQFWFVLRAVCEAHGVMDDNIKKATLVSVLQDHPLTWYIKHSNDYLNAGISEIHTALNREFSRPKSETQLIIGFKYIVMLLGETP